MPIFVESRGAVALQVPENANVIAVSVLALLSIEPFRHLMLDKPYIQPNTIYRLSNCLGNLAKGIWSRNTGTLYPGGLLKFMNDKYNLESGETGT
jgi:hypothetical protein